MVNKLQWITPPFLPEENALHADSIDILTIKSLCCGCQYLWISPLKSLFYLEDAQIKKMINREQNHVLSLIVASVM